MLRGELHADGGDFSMPRRGASRTWHRRRPLSIAPRSTTRSTATRIYARSKRASRRHRRHTTADGAAEAEAHSAFANADGYTAPARAETLLQGLGFTLEQTREPVASFSGGWRMRLNLAQALMCPSDLLLLDEPTNHLDRDAIVWLEDWLVHYAGTLVVISHDREFLDSVCNVTLHLENRQVKRYGGNYSQFEGSVRNSSRCNRARMRSSSARSRI